MHTQNIPEGGTDRQKNTPGREHLDGAAGIWYDEDSKNTLTTELRIWKGIDDK